MPDPGMLWSLAQYPRTVEVSGEISGPSGLVGSAARLSFPLPKWVQAVPLLFRGCSVTLPGAKGKLLVSHNSLPSLPFEAELFKDGGLFTAPSYCH